MYSRINYKMLGIRIRQRRKSLKITQEELAERMNISVSYLSLLENGKKKPSLSCLMQLCQELNTTMDFLLLGTPSPNTHSPDIELHTLLADYPQQFQALLIDFLQNAKSFLTNDDHTGSG